MSTFESPQFGESGWGQDPDVLLPPEEERPIIKFIINKTLYILSWENTMVRKFKVGEGQFDYFIHDAPDGGGIYVFFRHLDDNEYEYRRMFDDYGFPEMISPILDEDTIALYARMEGGDALDREFHSEFPTN